MTKRHDVPSLGAAFHWLVALVSPQEPTVRRRLRKPGKMPRLGVIRRSRLGAWWEARSAVVAGVRLEEFLRWRLARYIGRLPLAAAGLPPVLAAEDELQDAAAPSLLASCLAETGADRLRVRTDDEVAIAKRDMASLEADLARVQARLDAQTAYLDACVRDFEGAVADGSAAIRATEWATPEQLGRPPVPRPWALSFCWILAGSLVVAETLQLAVPFLRIAKLQPELARELTRRPFEAVPCLLMALGATAALLVLSRLALRQGSRVLQNAGNRSFLWRIAAAAGVSGAVVWALSDASVSASFAVLGLLMPFAAVWLLEHVEQLAAARVPLLERARAWDQEYRIAMAERIRHEELMERTRQERDRLVCERDSVQAELAAAARHSLEAERGYAATSSAERWRLWRLANSLNAALERDRYAFICEAARGGARELLVGSPPQWTSPPKEPSRPARPAAAQSAIA